MQRPGWRDPRLWIGLLLVAGSVVAGARLLASADDTVRVWAVRSDIAAGDTVTPEDLVPADIRFGDAGALSHYVAATDRLPADAHLLRGIGAGELLPRSALGSASDVSTVTVSIAVPASQVPTGVEPGATVSVHVVGEAPAKASDQASPVGGARRLVATEVLAEAVVIDAPAQSEGFGAVGGDRQLVLGVPQHESDALATILAASGEGTLRIVGQPS